MAEDSNVQATEKKSPQLRTKFENQEVKIEWDEIYKEFHITPKAVDMEVFADADQMALHCVIDHLRRLERDIGVLGMQSLAPRVTYNLNGELLMAQEAVEICTRNAAEIVKLVSGDG